MSVRIAPGQIVRSDVVRQTTALPARACGFESRRSHHEGRDPADPASLQNSRARVRLPHGLPRLIRAAARVAHLYEPCPTRAGRRRKSTARGFSIGLDSEADEMTRCRSHKPDGSGRFRGPLLQRQSCSGRPKVGKCSGRPKVGDGERRRMVGNESRKLVGAHKAWGSNPPLSANRQRRWSGGQGARHVAATHGSPVRLRP
jgi:hypothetical protein